MDKLAYDLSNETDLERWAEIDLYAAFLREDTVEDRRRSAPRSWVGSAVDLLPAALIFLPIVVTWFGLYQATLAYRHSRGDPDLVGKSFLEQWQTGFDNRLSEWLYFDRIALWTLLGIGVLVTASLVQAVVRRRSDQRDARERTDLMRGLATALTAADFQLSRFRMNDASRLALGSQHLIDAAEQVGRAGDTARAIQQEAQQSLRETRESLNRVKRLADALLKSENSVRAAAQRVGDATAGIGARLDDVSAATGLVAEAAADLNRSMSADSDKLRQAIQQTVTGSAQKIRISVSESQRELGTSISGALDSSGAGIRQALADWRTEGAIYSHRHETTAEHLGLIVDSIKRIMDQIQQLMDRTARSIDALPSTVDRFEEHSQQAAERLEQNMTTAAGRLATNLSEATDRLQKQLDRFLVGLPDRQSGTDQVTAELAALHRSIDLLRGQLGRTSGRRRWFG